MDKVTVYHFQGWDHNIGENVWAPRMATLEVIQRVNGVVDLATAQLVDKSVLDGNGFYPAKPPAIETPELRKVMRPSDMKAGEYYDSWDCQACNKPIALARRVTDSPPLELSNAVFKIRCPHCGAERHYGVHERHVRKFDASEQDQVRKAAGAD